MSQFREAHTTTPLSNGKVLIAGGARDGNATSTAELYDPASGTWTNTGPMRVNRQTHTGNAVAQRQGAGGRRLQRRPSFTGLNSAEVYDPATGSWTLVAPMNHNHFCTPRHC